MKIKIHVDTANIEDLKNYSKNKLIKGITTNPSLMKEANVKNYTNFAKKLCKMTNKDISLEVFADDEKNILKEAKILNSISNKIYVKIPIVNTKGKLNTKVIRSVLNLGIKVNITAIFTISQLAKIKKIIKNKDKIILSIFCGRIMDTGKSPKPISNFANKSFSKNRGVKLLWASTREIYNIFNAIELKYQIITISPNILSKLKNLNKNLNSYSKDTVKQFYKDAAASGLKIY